MDIKDPFFSVLIPLYNKADTIKRALDSVRNQVFDNFEVIIVDDGSTDDGAKIVEQYNWDKVTLYGQQNRGVSAARNRAAGYARSNYLTFLDADDEWLPDFLEEMHDLIQNFPDAALYGADVETVLVDGSSRSGRDRSIQRYCDIFKEAVLRFPFHTDGQAICKDKFFEVGGFTEGEKYFEDAALIFRLALKFKVAITEKVLTRYYSDAGESATQRMRSCNQVVFEHHRVIESALSEQGVEISHSLRKYARSEARKLLARCCVQNDFKGAHEIVDLQPLMTRFVWERKIYCEKGLSVVGQFAGKIVLLVFGLRVKMKLKTKWVEEFCKLRKLIFNNS